MKKTLLLILIFSTQLYSITLPLKRVKLTSTFGENRRDHFHNGIDFGAGEQDIHSILKGKLIFYYDKNEFPFDNYPGSGNYTIVEHTNHRSFYMHLKDNSINKTNYELAEGDVIARTSDTGHSRGIHLHFGIEKKHPHEILNPLIFFKDSFTDKLKPRIERFYIQLDYSDLIPVSHSYYITAGSQISLYLSTYDLIQNNNNKMGVYKITCYVNNEKTKEYIFDKLIIKNNYHYLEPNSTFNDIFLDKFIYKLGKLSIDKKEYKIRIVVEDFFGNTSIISRDLIIK